MVGFANLIQTNQLARFSQHVCKSETTFVRITLYLYLLIVARQLDLFTDNKDSSRETLVDSVETLVVCRLTGFIIKT